MTPELQKQIAEMLAKLTSATTDAASWTLSQLGPLVQEKIAFGRAWESFALVLLVVGVVAFSRIAKTSWAAFNVGSRYENEGWFIATIGSCVGGGICAILALFQSHDALLVWFAPRLYIIEWLKSMVTSK